MSTGDYSESIHDHSEPIGELEAATSEPERPPVISSNVEGLTIAEAAALYNISSSGIRRKLKEGKIKGAVKVPGPKGEEYRIPGESLEALGYVKQSSFAAVVIEGKAKVAEETYSARVTELEQALERESRLRELAEVKLEATEKNLEDLREALSRIPALTSGESPKRRGLFRRNK